jgi:tungstate transport system substrate-binding protein
VTRSFLRASLVLLLVWTGAATPLRAGEDDRSILVASTTSTQDSGLFDYLLPLVKQRTGITVKVVALGTGQALDTGRRGDADVVFVHDRDAEVKFVEDGEGVRRYPVMYNDFVLVGPASDPARVAGSKDIAAALASISRSQSPFVSRGDRSGTHQAELRLWKAAGISVGAGAWYRSVGQGMGAALNIASASNAYVLADRATWIRFGNKGELRLLVEGDDRLFNQYGVILVNPERHPNVKRVPGQQFIDYVVSPQGQADIAGFTVDGQPLFHPNANVAGR